MCAFNVRTPAQPPREGLSAPLWLRVLILAAVLVLAVRILGNVTESLTGMVEGHPPAAPASGR